MRGKGQETTKRRKEREKLRQFCHGKKAGGDQSRMFEKKKTFVRGQRGTLTKTIARRYRFLKGGKVGEKRRSTS